MKKILTASIVFFLSIITLFAQSQGSSLKEEQVIRFDVKNYDFGDVLSSQGPLSHTFTFKNVSSSPIVIHNVISSCGCTTPQWSREPIRPGGEGKIEVVYSNDQGAYPFDKTLTVYVSNIDKPVILRIKGTVHEQKKDIDELFTVRYGQLGLRKESVSIGYVDQNTARSDRMQIANMGRTDLMVVPEDIDNGLSLSIVPNPIPARGIATLNYTVDTKQTGGDDWGKNSYSTYFLLNGKKTDRKFTVTAMIKENFDDMTKEEISNAAVPTVDKSYFEFGEVKGKKIIECTYTVKNKGKEALKIYKVEGQTDALSVVTPCPITVKAGGKADIKVKFDTGKAEGEVIEIISVITNSPSKPIMNLFVTGNVQK